MSFCGFRIKWPISCIRSTAIWVFPHPVPKYTIIFSFIAFSHNSNWYLPKDKIFIRHLVFKKTSEELKKISTVNTKLRTSDHHAWTLTKKLLSEIKYSVENFTEARSYIVHNQYKSVPVKKKTWKTKGVAKDTYFLAIFRGSFLTESSSSLTWERLRDSDWSERLKEGSMDGWSSTTTEDFPSNMTTRIRCNGSRVHKEDR